MSSIKLKPDTGGGSFEIKAPSNSNNTRVLTLPDTGDLTLGGPYGKILQVKQAFKNDTQSTTSGSFIDLTGLSQSITVGTTGGVANKVLVMYNINSSGPGLVKAFNIVRGSTNIAQPANSSVSLFATQAMFVDANHFLNGAFTFLDTPTAGSHTYKI